MRLIYAAESLNEEINIAIRKEGMCFGHFDKVARASSN